MISLFTKTDDHSLAFGSMSICNCSSARVERAINGTYALHFIINKDDEPEAYEAIEAEMIVKAHTPDGFQLFRINQIKRDIEELSVSALHVAFDLRDCYIDDVVSLERARNATIQYLLKNALNNKNMVFDAENSDESDIIGDFSKQNTNILEILTDTNDESLSGFFGSYELDFDNYTFRIKNQLGVDNYFQLSDYHNIESIEIEVNTNDLITRIMPESNKGLRLPEKFIDSEYIDNYDKIYFACISFSEVDFEPLPTEQQDDTYNERMLEAQERLRELARAQYTEFKKDIPQESIQVNMIDLRYDKRYEDIRPLYELRLGDVVHIRSAVYPEAVRQRVVKYDYDPMRKEYTALTINSAPSELTDPAGSKGASTKRNEVEKKGGIYGYVENIDSGFSEVEQDWDSVDIRFGNANTNRIKNGAFKDLLEYWQENNTEGALYRVQKSEALNTEALQITAMGTDAFVISDEFKVRKSKQHVLSFKVRTGANTNGLRLEIMGATKEEAVTYPVKYLNKTIAKNTTELKGFYVFDTNDEAQFLRLRISHLGGSVADMVEITEVSLYEGNEFQSFNYKDAQITGSTAITKDGIRVTNDKNGQTHISGGQMAFEGNSGGVSGSFFSRQGTTSGAVKELYAETIQHTRRRMEDNHLITTTNPYNLKVNQLTAFFEQNTYAKRVQSSGLIQFRKTGGVTDEYLVIEGFKGGTLELNMTNLDIRGNVMIRNCDATIQLTGSRLTNQRPRGRLYGHLIIENCRDVRLTAFAMNSLRGWSASQNAAITVSNSTVLIDGLDVMSYMTFIEATNMSRICSYNCTGDVGRYCILNTGATLQVGEAFNKSIQIPKLVYSNDIAFSQASGAQFSFLGTDTFTPISYATETVPSYRAIVRHEIMRTNWIWGTWVYTTVERSNENPSWLMTQSEAIIAGLYEKKDTFTAIELADFSSTIVRNNIYGVTLSMRTYEHRERKIKLFTSKQDGVDTSPKGLADVQEIGEFTLKPHQLNFIDLPVWVAEQLRDGVANRLTFKGLKDEEAVYIDSHTLTITTSSADTLTKEN